MHDYEAETADQICAAEGEVERLRAELAAVRAAVAGEPVAKDASKLVKAIAGWRDEARRMERERAGFSFERSIARAEVRRLGGDPNALPRASGPWALSPGDYMEEGDRLAAEQVARATVPEDDGLTDADRDAGWRWELGGCGCIFLIKKHAHAAVASVGASGWTISVDMETVCGQGPGTGAAGQRAAVAHLRAAGVLPGGERSGA